MTGRLIVVEGLDGVGKSTLARRLADALGALLLRTPGDAVREARADVDDAWQASPVALQLFYAGSVVAASDAACIALEQGLNVVIDRYWASTMVYARRRKAWLELGDVEARLLPATATLWVEVPEEIRVERLVSRGELTPADKETLREGEVALLRADYLACLQATVHGRVAIVDGSLPPDAVLRQALSAVGC